MDFNLIPSGFGCSEVVNPLTYKISSNEINIAVIRIAEYYTSVKNAIETLVQNVIKSTEFKNYSVHIKKAKLLLDENQKPTDIGKEMENKITEVLAKFKQTYKRKAY
ncbi:hypothetical protein [Lysinibacillus sp. NPDC056232]|uniref:hypothetical protein n=1 Tax=Lysinibacillus sp. NPDC056232 TaxID=3345756 RepID=UPI0035D98018